MKTDKELIDKLFNEMGELSEKLESKKVKYSIETTVESIGEGTPVERAIKGLLLSLHCLDVIKIK